ncbi:MAG TPA: CYCXC family (seleno)protein [Candidatus Binataceae bacterium]|nr:CYCXC family (seleno)protein [Candidatus Binataceae bacterium]
MRKLLVAASLAIVVAIAAYFAVAGLHANSAVDSTADNSAIRTTLDPALFQGVVREAYLAAERYPAVLVQVHCYCGCDKVEGHRSLLDCYRDRHATTCPVCIGEAVMAAKMTGEDAPVEQIRDAIRARYAHGS